MWDSLQDLFLTLMDKQLVRGYEVEQCYIGALGSVTDEVRCLQEWCYSKRSSPFVCLFVCYVHCLLACYKVLVLLPVEKGVLLIGNRLFANCFQLDLSISFCVFLVKIKICCLFSFAR